MAREEPKLFSCVFIVLFFQALCCNCYIAVFYCMEQWMAQMSISPNMRGFLLSVLPAIVLLTRPSITYFLDGRNKTLPMLLSILASSAALLCYPLITSSHATLEIFLLRLVQGLAIAIYSSCTTTVLVECLPPGQSARGFAFFSLTLLLPYAIIPALGESLIVITGGEAQLFAWISILGLPALALLPILIPRLKLRQSSSSNKKAPHKSMWSSFSVKKLGLVYFACFCFTLMTNQAIFFVKGLCQVIGSVPAYFFTTYTSTIILVRLLANTLFNRLPSTKIIVFCSLILGLCTLGMSQTHGIFLIVFSFFYGLSMGLHYPLLAALVPDRSKNDEKSINSNLMMACFDASAFFAPILGGIILHLGFGYQGVFINATICIFLCGAAVWLDHLIQKKIGKARYSSH